MKTTLQQEVVRVAEELSSVAQSAFLSSADHTLLKQMGQRLQELLALLCYTPAATTPAPSGVLGTLKPLESESKPSISQRQVGGTHYLKHSIDPWVVIEAWNLDFFEGSALKYLQRYKDKGGLEDLKKLRHYVEKMEARYVSDRETPKKGVCRASGTSKAASETCGDRPGNPSS